MKTEQNQINSPYKILLKEPVIVSFVTALFLILFFAADGVQKFLVIYDYPFAKLTLILRGVSMLVFIGFIIAYFRRLHFEVLMGMLVLLTTWTIGKLYQTFFTELSQDFIFDIQLLIKHIYVFIAYLALRQLIYYENYFNLVIKALRFVFISNAVLAIIGLLFNIELLRTYSKYRFGFNGFIPAQNEATMFFMLGLLLEYHRAIYLNKNKITLFLLIFANILIGTKASWLFVLTLGIFHFYKAKNKAPYFVAFGTLLTIAIIYFLSTPELVGHYIWHYNQTGLMTMLFSGRDLFFEKRFFPLLENWSIVNYLFGGQNQREFLMELDFADLFLYFGIVGSAIYLWLIRKTYFSFSLKKAYNIYVVFVIFLIAALAGHYFSSALNAIYLALLGLYLSFWDLKTESMKNSTVEN
jgi:hypothetical protein